MCRRDERARPYRMNLHRVPGPRRWQAYRRAVRHLGESGEDRLRGAGDASASGPAATAGPRPAVHQGCHRQPRLPEFPAPSCGAGRPVGVGRSTITRAVGEIRPLLAAAGSPCPASPACGCAPGRRVGYAAARGVELRLDGTGVQVRRRARASRAAARSCQARRSGTRRRPPSSPTGKAAPCGQARPPAAEARRDRGADRGLAACSASLQVKAKVDAGYRGLARNSPIRCRPRRSRRRRTPPGRKRSLRGRTPQAVIGTDLRRARQRGAQAMADPAALPRTTRRLRRELPGRRRPGLRPRRRTVNPRQPTAPGELRPTADRMHAAIPPRP